MGNGMGCGGEGRTRWTDVSLLTGRLRSRLSVVKCQLTASRICATVQPFTGCSNQLSAYQPISHQT